MTILTKMDDMCYAFARFHHEIVKKMVRHIQKDFMKFMMLFMSLSVI